MIAWKWTAGLKPIFGRGTFDLKGGWNTLPAKTPLIPWQSGFHGCRAEEVPSWCGTELWRIEVDEAAGLHEAMGKFVFRRWRALRRLRWDREAMEAYARWCADCVWINANGARDAVSVWACGEACMAAAQKSARMSADAAAAMHVSETNANEVVQWVTAGFAVRAVHDLASRAVLWAGFACAERSKATGRDIYAEAAACEAGRRGMGLAQRAWIEERVGEPLEDAA